jgi:hypothetical protein
VHGLDGRVLVRPEADLRAGRGLWPCSSIHGW